MNRINYSLSDLSFSSFFEGLLTFDKIFSSEVGNWIWVINYFYRRVKFNFSQFIRNWRSLLCLCKLEQNKNNPQNLHKIPRKISNSQFIFCCRTKESSSRSLKFQFEIERKSPTKRNHLVIKIICTYSVLFFQRMQFNSPDSNKMWWQMPAIQRQTAFLSLN